MATKFEYSDDFPPLGGEGFGPGDEPWILDVGADPLQLDGHRDKHLLLIASPNDLTASVIVDNFGPVGEFACAGEGEDWGWTGIRVKLHVAATCGITTDPDDDPADTAIPGTLRPFDFGATLFAGADPTARSRPGEGVLDLDDPAGDDAGEIHAALLSYTWDSAPAIIKRGARGTAVSSWETVGRFRTAPLLLDLDRKQIPLRNLGWQLAGPLHEERYGCTGGLDGDPALTSLKGIIKPWSLGWCFNVEPRLINASLQIWQWSLGSSTALTDFRHGGVSQTSTTDYPTYDALAAATVTSGHYATCLAKSLVRWNGTLQYGVRVDVQGDADTAWGHPGPTTRAAIARRLATTWGPSRLDDNDEIDVNSLNRMEARHSATVGFHFRNETTKAAALDLVLGGILGNWRVGPGGQLAVGWVDTPALGSNLSLTYKAEGMGNPRKVATLVPRAGTRIPWRWNNAPQALTDLAGMVSDEATKRLYNEPARYAPSMNTSIAAMYPTSKIVTMGDSGFWYEADAIVEATRQQSLLEVERARWEWELDVDPFLDVLGRVVTLNGANVLGLGDVAQFLWVGLNAPAGAGNVNAAFWG